MCRPHRIVLYVAFPPKLPALTMCPDERQKSESPAPPLREALAENPIEADVGHVVFPPFAN